MPDITTPKFDVQKFFSLPETRTQFADPTGGLSLHLVSRQLDLDWTTITSWLIWNQVWDPKLEHNKKQNKDKKGTEHKQTKIRKFPQTTWPT